MVYIHGLHTQKYHIYVRTISISYQICSSEVRFGTSAPYTSSFICEPLTRTFARCAAYWRCIDLFRVSN